MTTQPAYFSDRQVASRYNVDRTTWWRWVNNGQAPKPIKLSPGCTRWRVSDLEQWEEERKQEVQA